MSPLSRGDESIVADLFAYMLSSLPTSMRYMMLSSLLMITYKKYYKSQNMDKIRKEMSLLGADFLHAGHKLEISRIIYN